MGNTTGASTIEVLNTNGGAGAYLTTANLSVLVTTTGSNGAHFSLDPASSGYTTDYGTPSLTKDVWQ